VVRASRTREENVIIVIVEGEGVSNESASKGDCLGRGRRRKLKRKRVE